MQKRKKCQLCNYKMHQDKWKGVVLCSHHGVRLCTESHQPRSVSKPMLLQDNGKEATDSYICEEEGSCWTKLHRLLQGSESCITKKKQLLIPFIVFCINDIIVHPGDMFNDFSFIRGPITWYTITMITCNMLFRRMRKGYFTIYHLLMMKTKVILNFIMIITSLPLASTSCTSCTMHLCHHYVIGDPSTPSSNSTTDASKIIRVMSSIWVMLET
jgi:hypothetical protein